MRWRWFLLLVPLAFFVSCGEEDKDAVSIEQIQEKLVSLEQRNRELQRELARQKEGIASKDETLKKVLVELETDRKNLKSQLEEVKEQEKQEKVEAKKEEKEVSEKAEEKPNLVEKAEKVGLSEIEKTPQVQLIKAFYELLEVGEVEKAYNMRVEDDVPLEAFENWYGSITEIRPRSFEEGDEENQYSFLVDYSDGDTLGALYRVVMKTVEDDKVQVIASWKIEAGRPVTP